MLWAQVTAFGPWGVQWQGGIIRHVCRAGLGVTTAWEQQETSVSTRSGAQHSLERTVWGGPPRDGAPKINLAVPALRRISSGLVPGEAAGHASCKKPGTGGQEPAERPVWAASGWFPDEGVKGPDCAGHSAHSLVSRPAPVCPLVRGSV